MRSAIVVLLALAFSGCAYSGPSYKLDPKFAPLLEIREDKTISYSDMAFTKGLTAASPVNTMIGNEGQ